MIPSLHSIETSQLQQELLGQLLDTQSIEDIGNSHGLNFDGVYCGIGSYREQKLVFAIQDFSYKGGSSGLTHAKQMNEAIERAIQENIPLLLFLSTGGARIQEGVPAIHESTKIIHSLTKSSGRIPTIAIIIGPCAALGAYLSSICDCCIFIKHKSKLFLTGPKVIQSAIGQAVDSNSFGGLDVHAYQTGIATHIVEDYNECQLIISKLLTLFCLKKKSFTTVDIEVPNEKFNRILPINVKLTYDMNRVIDLIIDNGSASYFIPHFADNILTLLASIQGKTVGIIANQPKVLSGCMDVKSSLKLSRFMQICDAHNIPMIFLVDCPGFLPGPSQEKAGAVNIGSRAAQILASCECPRITVIIRRMIGGSYAVLNSKAMGADYVIAWKNAEIAIMGEAACVSMNSEYQKAQALSKIKEQGIIDEVIDPSYTKSEIVKALQRLKNKKKDSIQYKRRYVLPI